MLCIRKNWGELKQRFYIPKLYATLLVGSESVEKRAVYGVDYRVSM